MSRANDMVHPAPQSDTPNNTIQCGLTIREHLAGLAMQGMLASADKHFDDYEWLANRAVTAADLLIAELAKVQS